jgi:hypothetical protein
MSTYMTQARDRKTLEIFAVTAIDDYFGNHAYGYEIHERDGDVLTEEQFRKQYEEISHDRSE